MILNTTNKPYHAFGAMQRLATHGETVVSQHVTTIEAFDTFYGRYPKIVTMVIIDPTDFILANEICNTVTCPVVTLDVEHVIDSGAWTFREYNPDEV